MKKVKFACQLLVQKIGNQLQKRIKVKITKSKFHEPFGSTNETFLRISVIQALIALVNDPEPEHPLRGDLAEEFLKDHKKFLKNAEEYTRKYGEKRPNEY